MIRDINAKFGVPNLAKSLDIEDLFKISRFLVKSIKQKNCDNSRTKHDINLTREIQQRQKKKKKWTKTLRRQIMTLS